MVDSPSISVLEIGGVSIIEMLVMCGICWFALKMDFSFRIMEKLWISAMMSLRLLCVWFTWYLLLGWSSWRIVGIGSCEGARRSFED